MSNKPPIILLLYYNFTPLRDFVFVESSIPPIAKSILISLGLQHSLSTSTSTAHFLLGIYSKCVLIRILDNE